MAARIFWLALFLAASVERVQAQADRPDPKQDSGRATATSDAAKENATDEPLPAGAIARLGTTRFRPTRTASGVSFLPDNRTLVQTVSGGTFEYWDALSGRLLRSARLPGHRNATAYHTANGRFIALRGSDLSEQQGSRTYWVKLVDAATAQELMHLALDKFRGEHLAVSADGSTIVANGEKLSVLDTRAKTEVLNRPIEREVHSLAVSPDSKLIAVGGEGHLLIWDWAGSDEPKRVPMVTDTRRPNIWVLAVQFSPDGAYLAAGADSFPGITLLDVKTAQEVRRFDVAGVKFWYPRSLAFSADGSMLAAPIDRNSGGGVAVWQVATGKLLVRLHVPHESVSDVAFSPDGRLLAGTSSWERQMCVWNVATGQLLGKDLQGHSESPSSVRFLPGDRRLASAGDDGTIRIWNVAEAKEERVIAHPRDANSQRIRWIRAMDVSPDGRFIASSSLDDTVRVWETDTGREVYRLPGHGQLGGRRSVRFTPDNERLVSWGDDMQVNIWDVRTGKAVNEYRAQPSGVKLPNRDDLGDPFGAGEGVFRLDGGMISADASRLLVRGGQTYIFDVPTGKELARFERTVGANTGLAISPDNSYTIALSWGPGREIQLQGGGVLFTAAKNHLVHLRALADGKLVSETKLPEGGIGVAAFSPDSRRVAITIDDDNPRVLILQVPELKEVARIEGLRGRAGAIEFSRSGKLLAVADADTSIVVYDLEKLPMRQKPMNSD
jgi:WD40 repeat protein